MPITLGTRGNGGKSLVRDTKAFNDNLDDVDFGDRSKRKPDRVRSGKKTWVYGKKTEPQKIEIDTLVPPVV